MRTPSLRAVVKIVPVIFRAATANMQRPRSHRFLIKLPKSPLQFPNSGVFLFTLRKPTPRRSAWMCFLFRPRDKTEPVITWRASALNQTLHFLASTRVMMKGTGERGGRATQTRDASLQVAQNLLWKQDGEMICTVRGDLPGSVGLSPHPEWAWFGHWDTPLPHVAQHK